MINTGNLDIFIFTHKDEFDLCPSNKCYKIVSIKDFKTRNHNIDYIFCDKGLGINKLQHSYSEGSMIYWLWKNYELKDYVGTSQYRKYFDFFDDIPNIDDIFSKYDGIIRTPIYFNSSVYEQYKACHNEEDLICVVDIVKKKYPDIFGDFINFLDNNKFVPCNMFIVKKETFLELCEFVFGVLFEFDSIHSFKTDEDVANYCKIKNNIYENKPDSNLESQNRIQGFLFERLVSFFLLKNLNNPLKIDAFEYNENKISIANKNTLLCCIGRLENNYIREYVEYYKNLGVTNICLYDNNREGEDDFNEVIGDYIKDGYVILKNYRGIKEPCQLNAYNECYEEYKNDYDWILFFDIDEFLMINGDIKLSQYLSNECFDNYDMIHVNWLLVGDCGQLKSDGKPLLLRLNKPLDVNLQTLYNFPDNFHVKSIVRGGLKNVQWNSTPHTPLIDGKCCNGSGILIEDKNSPFFPYDYRGSALLHFSTKTASEYADKVNRGFCDGNNVTKEKMIELFFQRNEVTKEKIKIFKEKTGVDVSYLLPYEGSKNDEIKIYSLCYSKKNFKFLDDSVITPLQVGAANGTDICKLKDNIGENISDKNYFYVENTGTYLIWKNVEAKYKGQMQYRRPLSGVSDTMDFESIFSHYDVITCEPFYHPDHKEPTKEEPMFIPADTVEGGYAFSNCIDDLSLLEIVIKMYHSDYSSDYDKYIKEGGNLYYSNGFIMRGEDFDRYSEFLFDCLEKYLSFANINNKEELIEHVKYNLSIGKYIRYNGIGYSEADINWQTKIGGFLSERIWTLWVQHNFSDDKIYKIPYIKMESNMYT